MMTIEQLENDRKDLQRQLEQAIRAEEQARQQRAMLQGALQYIEIQMQRYQGAGPEMGEGARGEGAAE